MFKVEIGAKVCVGSSASTAKRGIVRYIGETHFAGGEWIGVQLYEKDGKNDGSVDDTRYFDCEPEHGLFARRTLVRQDREDATSTTRDKLAALKEKQRLRAENLASSPLQKARDEGTDATVPATPAAKSSGIPSSIAKPSSSIPSSASAKGLVTPMPNKASTTAAKSTASKPLVPRFPGSTAASTDANAAKPAVRKASTTAGLSNTSSTASLRSTTSSLSSRAGTVSGRTSTIGSSIGSRPSTTSSTSAGAKPVGSRLGTTSTRRTSTVASSVAPSLSTASSLSSIVTATSVDVHDNEELLTGAESVEETELKIDENSVAQLASVQLQLKVAESTISRLEEEVSDLKKAKPASDADEADGVNTSDATSLSELESAKQQIQDLNALNEMMKCQSIEASLSLTSMSQEKDDECLRWIEKCNTAERELIDLRRDAEELRNNWTREESVFDERLASVKAELQDSQQAREEGKQVSDKEHHRLDEELQQALQRCKDLDAKNSVLQTSLDENATVQEEKKERDDLASLQQVMEQEQQSHKEKITALSSLLKKVTDEKVSEVEGLKKVESELTAEFERSKNELSEHLLRAVQEKEKTDVKLQEASEERSVEKVKFEKARQQQLELHQLEVQTLQSDLKDLSSAGKEADILIKSLRGQIEELSASMVSGEDREKSVLKQMQTSLEDYKTQAEAAEAECGSWRKKAHDFEEKDLLLKQEIEQLTYRNEVTNKELTAHMSKSTTQQTVLEEALSDLRAELQDSQQAREEGKQVSDKEHHRLDEELQQALQRCKDLDAKLIVSEEWKKKYEADTQELRDSAAAASKEATSQFECKVQSLQQDHDAAKVALERGWTVERQAAEANLRQSRDECNKLSTQIAAAQASVGEAASTATLQIEDLEAKIVDLLNTEKSLRLELEANSSTVKELTADHDAARSVLENRVIELEHELSQNASLMGDLEGEIAVLSSESKQVNGVYNALKEGHSLMQQENTATVEALQVELETVKNQGVSALVALEKEKKDLTLQLQELSLSTEDHSNAATQELHSQNNKLSDKVYELEQQNLELSDNLEMLAMDKEQLMIDNEMNQEKIESLEQSMKNGAATVSNEGSVAGEGDMGSLKNENIQLREALRRLHEVSSEEVAQLKESLVMAELSVEELALVQEECAELQDYKETAAGQILELQQAVDDCSEYETMIESLTTQNLQLNQHAEELELTVSDLEAAQDLSNELDESQRASLDGAYQEIDSLTVLLHSRTEEVGTLERKIVVEQNTVDKYRAVVEGLKNNMDDTARRMIVETQEALESSQVQRQLSTLRQSCASHSQRTKNVQFQLLQSDLELSSLNIHVNRLKLYGLDVANLGLNSTEDDVTFPAVTTATPSLACTTSMVGMLKEETDMFSLEQLLTSTVTQCNLSISLLTGLLNSAASTPNQDADGASTTSHGPGVRINRKERTKWVEHLAGIRTTYHSCVSLMEASVLTVICASKTIIFPDYDAQYTSHSSFKELSEYANIMCQEVELYSNDESLSEEGDKVIPHSSMLNRCFSGTHKYSSMMIRETCVSVIKQTVLENQSLVDLFHLENTAASIRCADGGCVHTCEETQDYARRTQLAGQWGQLVDISFHVLSMRAMLVAAKAYVMALISLTQPLLHDEPTEESSTDVSGYEANLSLLKQLIVMCDVGIGSINSVVQCVTDREKSTASTEVVQAMGNKTSDVLDAFARFSLDSSVIAEESPASTSASIDCRAVQEVGQECVIVHRQCNAMWQQLDAIGFVLAVVEEGDEAPSGASSSASLNESFVDAWSKDVLSPLKVVMSKLSVMMHSTANDMDGRDVTLPNIFDTVFGTQMLTRGLKVFTNGSASSSSVPLSGSSGDGVIGSDECVIVPHWVVRVKALKAKMRYVLAAESDVNALSKVLQVSQDKLERKSEELKCASERIAELNGWVDKCSEQQRKLELELKSKDPNAANVTALQQENKMLEEAISVLERRLQTMDKEYKLLKSGRGVESSEGGAVPLHVPGGCVVIASDVTQALQASISYSLKLQATAISQVSHSLTPIPLPRRLRLHPCTCLAPSLAGKLDYQDLTSAADKSSDSTVVEAEAPSASNALDISTGARKIIKHSKLQRARVQLVSLKGGGGTNSKGSASARAQMEHTLAHDYKAVSEYRTRLLQLTDAVVLQHLKGIVA